VKLYYSIATKENVENKGIFYADEPNPDIGFMEIKRVTTGTKAIIGFNSKWIEQVHDIIKLASLKLKVTGIQLWTTEYFPVPNIDYIREIFKSNPSKSFQPKFLLATQEDVDNPPKTEEIPADETPDIGYVIVNKVKGTGRGRTLAVSNKTRQATFLEDASKALEIKGIEFWDDQQKFLDLPRIQKLILSDPNNIKTIYLATKDDLNGPTTEPKKLGYIVIQRASTAQQQKGGGVNFLIYDNTNILIEASKKLGIEGKAIWDDNGNQVDDDYVKDQVSSKPKFFIATEKDILDQQDVK